MQTLKRDRQSGQVQVRCLDLPSRQTDWPAPIQPVRGMRGLADAGSTLMDELLHSPASRHIADIYGPVCCHRNGMGPDELAIVVAEAAE